MKWGTNLYAGLHNSKNGKMCWRNSFFLALFVQETKKIFNVDKMMTKGFSSTFEQQSYRDHEEIKAPFPLMLMSRMVKELTEEKGEIRDRNKNTTTITDGMVFPYTLDELESLYSETRDNEAQTSSILRTVSAIISIIASSTLIWMISRSEKGFGSTQNRLLLGICISDIIFSISFSFCNLTAPASDAYMTWNAKGNMATCEAQGFLTFLGFSSMMFYHSSLNIFYLMVLKYEKSTKHIQTNIEPFFHGIPIVLGLIFSIVTLVNGNLNHGGNGICNASINKLPHCIGYQPGDIRDGFEIPCYRGNDSNIAYPIIFGINLGIPSIVIATSLTMINRHITTLENRMSQFGAASFRARIQEREANAIDGNTFFAPFFSCVRTFKTWVLCKKDSINYSSGHVSAEKRTMRNKAIAYSVSLTLTITVTLINPVLHRVLKQERNYVIFSITNFFLPLQGLYNLLIYSHSKAMNIKSTKKVRYWEAFVEVVMEKHNKNEEEEFHEEGSEIALRNQSICRLSILKKSRRGSKALVEVDEEEKCEIQPFEGQRGKQPEQEDQHFLGTNPSFIDESFPKISTEIAQRPKPVHQYSDWLSEIEDGPIGFWIFVTLMLLEISKHDFTVI